MSSEKNITRISFFYIVAIVILMLVKSISITPDRLFLLLALFAVVIGKGKMFLRDWLPFVGLFLGYEVLRGFADSVGFNVNFTGLIWGEKLITGSMPTIWLQNKFYQPRQVNWYDVVGVILYFLHFVNPLLVAFLFWWKDKKLYWQFVFGLLVLSFSAFLFFVVFPSAPPWLAAKEGYLPPIHKIIDETLDKSEINYSISFLYQKLNPNPVAAFPSLHAGFSWLTLLVLSEYSAVLTVFFLPIAVSTLLAIVYLGEHYVIDAISGVVLATIVYLLIYRRTQLVLATTYRKFFYYAFVATIFTTNVLILFKGPTNIGFGHIFFALIGLLLALIGFVFWLGGMYSLREGFSLFPKPKKLVKKGLYRLVKHPIYIGMTLAFTGLALAKGNLLGVMFTLGVTTPLNFFRAKAEEKELLEKFGVKYKSEKNSS